jgi:hypothetical protein
MQLETLSCNNCGAPLAVPKSANFVCCNHCGTNLVVRRDSSVSYTEKVDEIHERTGSMVQQLADVRYQQELANIDRQWDLERQKYLVADDDGVRHKPPVVLSIIIGTVFAAIGLGMLLLPAWPVQLMGLLFLLAGVGAIIQSSSKAAALQRAQAEYQRRRSQVRIDDFLPRSCESAPPQ